MLGFGHNDERINPSVARDHCMANVMTPALSQLEFFKAFKAQIGVNRADKTCPYSRIMCLNSGSEAVELSARLTDTHAHSMTKPGAVHAGRKSTMMCLEGSFYGRTCVHRVNGGGGVVSLARVGVACARAAAPPPSGLC